MYIVSSRIHSCAQCWTQCGFENTILVVLVDLLCLEFSRLTVALVIKNIKKT